jgi:hypothetical protein
MRAKADDDRPDFPQAGTPAGAHSRRRRAIGPALLAAAMLLSACGGDGGGGDEPEPTPEETPSETATPAAEEDEQAATLTAPGSQLAFGDTATVEYSAGGDQATLALTVRSAEKGSIDDFSGFDTQDALVRNANFYYVRVRVENVGDKRFGNAEVPLWGISGQDTLLPPVKFTTSFDTCPTENLPKRFRPGDTFGTCLVFLSPKRGSLEGVSYRPTVEFTPIEWRGKVQGTGGKGQKKQGGNDRGNNQGGNNQGNNQGNDQDD